MRTIALLSLLILVAAITLQVLRSQGMDLLPGMFVEELEPTIASALLVLAAALLCIAIKRFAYGIAEGERDWQKRVRAKLGADDDDGTLREVIWAKWSLVTLIWIAVPLAVLKLWQLDNVFESVLERLLGTGIQIGEFQIIPGQLLLGMLVFVALVSIVRWVSYRLEHRWLLRTPLEASLRESVATLFGYTAFVIAILVGLGVGGVDMTKFAILAGALGVGIGFGLQNIVNNFVSGLILLFERPVRTGDFIAVGGSEGTVRKVRIRATEIQTLNNQNIIIPNSELISTHVTNWMLRDKFCRITVGVGVAYGSNTELVRKILFDVVEEHEEAFGLDQNLAPKPMVWFTNFGDSSLDFEIKCYIQDVTRRYIVSSEMRFAIDAKFREHNVTIPFPQRDVWFKDPLAVSREGQPSAEQS